MTHLLHRSLSQNKEKIKKEVQLEENSRNTSEKQASTEVVKKLLQTALQIYNIIIWGYHERPWKYRQQHDVVWVFARGQRIQDSIQETAVSVISVRPHSHCQHLSDLQKAFEREGKWVSELCVLAIYILLVTKSNSVEQLCQAPAASPWAAVTKSHIFPVLSPAVH